MKEYIDANIGNSLCVDDLAHLVDRRPRTFLRDFYRTFGTTPHKHVVAERISRAKRLLRNGTPVATVTRMLGFANQSHFSTVF